MRSKFLLPLLVKNPIFLLRVPQAISVVTVNLPANTANVNLMSINVNATASYAVNEDNVENLSNLDNSMVFPVNVTSNTGL